MFKRKVVKFEIPDDARELTDEEMILVNGGGAMTPQHQAEIAEAYRTDDQGKVDEIMSHYQNSGSGTTTTTPPSTTGTTPTTTTPPASVPTTQPANTTPSSSSSNNNGSGGPSGGGSGSSGNGGSGSSRDGSSSTYNMSTSEIPKQINNMVYAENMKKTNGTYYQNIPGTKYQHKKARVYEQQALKNKQMARELIESASYCPQLPPKPSSNVTNDKTKTSGRWGTINTQEALSMRMQDYRETPLNKMNGTHLEEIPKGSGNWKEVDNQFSKSGCLMQAVAKLATEIKGEKVSILDINNTFDKNKDGCLSLDEIKEGLKTCRPEGKNLVSQEINNVTKKDFDTISSMGTNTYVLGKADSVVGGDHWINLESYRINEYDQVEFFYAPTSRNDAGRRFVLGPLQEGQENSNFFSISRIQTYTVCDSMLFLK